MAVNPSITVTFWPVNATGTLLWKRESNTTQEGWYYPYGMAFDQENNIYIGGSFVQNSAITNNYLGYIMPIFQNRQFIMKLNPDASQVLWSSNSETPGLEQGGIVYNLFTNQVALTGICYGTYTWGSQSLQTNVISNQGLDVLLARFDKTTGACVALSQMTSNIGSNDNGTALAVDLSGDYIVGGAFSGSIYPNATLTLTSIGGQSDFFVAKYATQACSPLSIDAFDKTSLQVYPNPTTGLVTIDVTETTNFEVLDVSGKVLQKGILTVSENVVDLNALGKGMYFLRVDSLVKKIVKQ